MDGRIHAHNITFYEMLILKSMEVETNCGKVVVETETASSPKMSDISSLGGGFLFDVERDKSVQN